MIIEKCTHSENSPHFELNFHVFGPLMLKVGFSFEGHPITNHKYLCNGIYFEHPHGSVLERNAEWNDVAIPTSAHASRPGQASTCAVMDDTKIRLRNQERHYGICPFCVRVLESVRCRQLATFSSARSDETRRQIFGDQQVVRWNIAFFWKTPLEGLWCAHISIIFQSFATTHISIN